MGNVLDPREQQPETFLKMSHENVDIFQHVKIKRKKKKSLCQLKLRAPPAGGKKKKSKENTRRPPPARVEPQLEGVHIVEAGALGGYRRRRRGTPRVAA